MFPSFSKPFFSPQSVLAAVNRSSWQVSGVPHQIAGIAVIKVQMKLKLGLAYRQELAVTALPRAVPVPPTEQKSPR